MTDKKTKQLPLYIQIGELLHREIAAGHWLPGERLPVESTLAATLGVAIGTLRKSLAKLEEDGLLERRQGSGTYIKRVSGSRAIYQFFHLELLGGGGVPTADTLSLEVDEDPFVLDQLQISDKTEKLWCIRRSRYLNRQLVAVEQIWFRHSHGTALKLKDLHESLYLHYRENFSFWISRVEDEIDCAAAPDWVTEKLGLASQSMLPKVLRRSWSNEGKIEEFSFTWYDPTKCRYFARWH
ncbi:GntR family transcriptional regulator [Marinomonas ushuaiensis DSM 15871]|uniref:GntR family transcriptional regulator n=1 Tax=Marinomonas ushuaiensis DSM 15871 TaxID=1122207 RepID=X7E437_9GAMM|nr:GntR family transcriptional regulator [Marinomonas ushuaiensis]ETX10829.1 GntR family transcriptional regulator [Marinomonas ushuaiensis DSM 15871]